MSLSICGISGLNFRNTSENFCRILRLVFLKRFPSRQPSYWNQWYLWSFKIIGTCRCFVPVFSCVLLISRRLKHMDILIFLLFYFRLVCWRGFHKGPNCHKISKDVSTVLSWYLYVFFCILLATEEIIVHVDILRKSQFYSRPFY